jgi:tRNA (mo5U34)-methyltransferase
MSGPYQNLKKDIDGEMPWMKPLIELSEQIIKSGSHGDLPGWLKVLNELPAAKHGFDGSGSVVSCGKLSSDTNTLAGQLLKFHPWRKGPLNIGGVPIETEWRSDKKWDRLQAHLSITGHKVMDIGCGNGYFGWRMLDHGASSVIGIDPTLIYTMQWLASQHFAGDLPNYVLPLSLEDLPETAGGFDTIFSMGVLYHRRDPVEHLKRLAGLVKKGGQIVLETLVLESESDQVLVPEGRYARMRNVWAIPTVPRLINWMNEAGLQSIKTLDVSHTTADEQRSTDWMHFESLAESLDPGNSKQTLEGHPAPVRAAMIAVT